MSSLQIVGGPHVREPALRLLFGHLPADERQAQISDVLAAYASGKLALDGLLLARRDGVDVGASLFVTQPGRTAFVWPPAVPAGPDAEAVADRLLQEAGARLDAAEVALAQSLVEPADRLNRARLERNGFPLVAELAYLRRGLETPISADVPHHTFSRIPFDERGNPARFAAVLEATYAGSLDVPAIQGRRSGQDALEAHRGAGVFSPSLWEIWQDDGGDAGVLLVTDHPELDAREIVYLGVVPRARGRGVGRAMAAAALNDARDAGRAAVLLAVDVRNSFARRMYDALGFTVVSTQAVHLRMPR